MDGPGEVRLEGDCEVKELTYLPQELALCGQVQADQTADKTGDITALPEQAVENESRPVT